jgi:hypothetical protein
VPPGLGNEETDATLGKSLRSTILAIQRLRTAACHYQLLQIHKFVMVVMASGVALTPHRHTLQISHQQARMKRTGLARRHSKLKSEMLYSDRSLKQAAIGAAYLTTSVLSPLVTGPVTSELYGSQWTSHGVPVLAE